MYSTKIDTVVACSTHISPRMIGSPNGLIMALSTHLQKGEMWGKTIIVTIAPSVRLANEGRQKPGQPPFRWYSLIWSENEEEEEDYTETILDMMASVPDLRARVRDLRKMREEATRKMREEAMFLAWNIPDPQQDEARMNGAEGTTLGSIIEGITNTTIETSADNI